MKYIFICKNCGNIQEYNKKQGTRGLKCKKCCNEMGWESSFPPLTALDFENSAHLLLEQSKKQDKENLQTVYSYVKEGFDVDKTFIDKWINKYESWLEKYPDNSDTVWTERDDKFEDIICYELGENLGLCIFSAVHVIRNYYRKPYIIIVASLIEQLFNDYFREVVTKKLSQYGKNIFLDKYDTVGIQASIDIIDSFLDESLSKKMNKYSDGFFDKWTNLRKLRNDIIHSNSIYVSKIKISKINKMIEESFLVFYNLKSEIYKN